MTHRNTSAQTLQATSNDAALTRVGQAAVLGSALVLVLVLITVQSGAGIGFA